MISRILKFLFSKKSSTLIDLMKSDPTGEKISGKVYVIDGDTVEIKGTRVRLAGVDAPEIDQPFGKASKFALVKMCKGKVVTAFLTGEDSYNRKVGTCYLPDGRDVGAELIRLGLALDFTKFSGGKYKSIETEDARKKLRHKPFR